MSEPNEEKLKSLVEIFLPFYNNAHKTDFAWKKGKSYLANNSSKQYVDAEIFSGKKKIEIQHKQVVWDIFHDVIRAGRAEKIISAIVDKMHSQGLNEYTFHVNFDSDVIPRDKETISRIAFFMSELIARKAHPFFSNTQAIFSFEKDDDLYLNELKPFFSYIHIFSRPGSEKPGFGFGWSKLEPRPLPHYGNRIVEEVTKQANWYQGLVLLIEAATVVDEYDFRLIAEQLNEHSYSCEIWVVENFGSKRHATRIN